MKLMSWRRLSSVHVITQFSFFVYPHPLFTQEESPESPPILALSTLVTVFQRIRFFLEPHLQAHFEIIIQILEI